jgi:leader peptidase (prepilin peptidase)/N-methyltransferase
MAMFEYFATVPALLMGSVFLVSLLVGSFLNVVIHRLPIMLDRQWREQARETLTEDAAPADSTDLGAETLTAGLNPTAIAEVASPEPPSPPADRAQPSPDAPYNLVVPRSACPHCGALIKAHQNIPVLSYLILGGKCANCRARISPRYPIVELATAVLSMAVAWRYGWHWQTLAALVFTWALIALTVIDLDHEILPDAITLPMLWLGLLLALAWHAALRPTVPVDPVSAIAGAAAGYLVLWLVYWAFKLIMGKEGMGYGDFKLLGALGAWMGWQMLPLVILLSASTGAIVGIALVVLRGRDRGQPMPFGPFLAAAGWVAMMWGPQIMGGYLRFTGLAD